MPNEVFHDTTRERFEQVNFPDYMTAQYLGRMNARSSLGRYVLGISPTNLPLRITQMDVKPVTFYEAIGDSIPENGRNQTMMHVFDTTFKLDDAIAAFYAEYQFFDIWGEKIGGYGYHVVQDHTGGTLETVRHLAYDFFDEEINGLASQVAHSTVTSMTPIDFHICVFGIMHCRTTDGMLYKANQDEIEGALSYAIPRG